MILDSETAAFMKVIGILAPLGLIQKSSIITIGEAAPSPQQTQIEQWIRGRIEFVQAGVDRCPTWFQKDLKRFDRDLRVRWDFYRAHWVIERYNVLDNLFHACGIWSRPLGPALIQNLHDHDLWKSDPRDIVRAEHDRAERQERSNQAAVDDQRYGAIDAMTNRQAEEFVKASEALVTGEEIVPMGDDAKFMQRRHDEHQAWLAEQERRKP